MLSEPQDKEDLDTIVEVPQLTTSPCKKTLQVVDDVTGVGHFMNRCYKLKHKTEATIIPYKDVYMYKDIMKKVKHLKIIFCIWSCAPPSGMHAACFSHTCYFQHECKRYPIKNLFKCLMFIID
jgi:hypothetical protein